MRTEKGGRACKKNVVITQARWRSDPGGGRVGREKGQILDRFQEENQKDLLVAGVKVGQKERARDATRSFYSR